MRLQLTDGQAVWRRRPVIAVNVDHNRTLPVEDFIVGARLRARRLTAPISDGLPIAQQDHIQIANRMAKRKLETPRTLNIDVVEVPSTFANTATNSPSSDATGLLGKVIWFEIFITTFGAVGWQSGYDGG